MAQPLTRLTVDVPADLEGQIAALAEQTGRSRSVIVNDAIGTYVKGQLQWLTDMDAASADVANGETLEGEDLLQWLESWGTDKELTRPNTKKL